MKKRPGMRKEKKTSIVDLIRQKVESSAGSNMTFIKIKDKEKRRVRILTDFDDFVMVKFHDNWSLGVGNPCYKYFGRSNCPFCDKTKDDGYRTRDLFIFSVFDYDSREVKLMMEAANSCSPIEPMIDFYDTHGTLCDRDYTISRRGKSFDTSYTLIPGDRKTFSGEGKFEAFDADEVFDKLKERYLNKMKDILKKIKNGTFGEVVNEEDEEEEKQVKPSNKARAQITSGKRKKSKAQKPVIEDDDEIFEDDDGEEYEEDYAPKRRKKTKPIKTKFKRNERYYTDEDDNEILDDYDDDEYDDE